jgi:hypothetical protein
VRALSGGLRLRVLDGARSADRFNVAEALLRAIPGVSVVAADARAGSISIAYQPPSSAIEPVIEVLAGEPVPSAPRHVAIVRPVPAPGWAAWVGRTIVVVAVEVVLQRLLGPLFPRRC